MNSRSLTTYDRGKSNPIEKRLNAYDNGDVNRPEDLAKWRTEWTKPSALTEPEGAAPK